MNIATICFPIRNGEVYLAEKKDGFGIGFLNGYGGKMDEGDVNIEAAAMREIQEESGVLIRAEDLEKVAILDFINGETHKFECHVYIFRKWEFVETEEMKKAEPFSLSELPFERMFPADRKWIPLVLGGEKIRAVCHLSEDLKEGYKCEYRAL